MSEATKKQIINYYRKPNSNDNDTRAIMQTIRREHLKHLLCDLYDDETPNATAERVALEGEKKIAEFFNSLE